MKIVQIIIWLSLAFGILACDSNKKNEQLSESDNKIMYYTCPMESHKHIHSQEAGKTLPARLLTASTRILPCSSPANAVCGLTRP